MKNICKTCLHAQPPSFTNGGCSVCVSWLLLKLPWYKVAWPWHGIFMHAWYIHISLYFNIVLFLFQPCPSPHPKFCSRRYPKYAGKIMTVVSWSLTLLVQRITFVFNFDLQLSILLTKRGKSSGRKGGFCSWILLEKNVFFYSNNFFLHASFFFWFLVKHR